MKWVKNIQEEFSLAQHQALVPLCSNFRKHFQFHVNAQLFSPNDFLNYDANDACNVTNFIKKTQTITRKQISDVEDQLEPQPQSILITKRDNKYFLIFKILNFFDFFSFWFNLSPGLFDSTYSRLINNSPRLINKCGWELCQISFKQKLLMLKEQALFFFLVFFFKYFLRQQI